MISATGSFLTEIRDILFKIGKRFENEGGVSATNGNPWIRKKVQEKRKAGHTEKCFLQRQKIVLLLQLTEE